MDELQQLKDQLAAEQAKAEALAGEKQALEKAVAAAKAEKDKALGKISPIAIKVKEDKDHDVEAGTYKFTCDSITHKGQVLNVRAMATSPDPKVKEKFSAVCAELLIRKSGVLKRKEGK